MNGFADRGICDVYLASSVKMNSSGDLEIDGLIPIRVQGMEMAVITNPQGGKPMKINVTNGTLTEEEIQHYVDYVREKNPKREIESIDIEVDGEFVNLSWELAGVWFERIRRITGYLSTDYRHFNDAKQAEVLDRVKHSIGERPQVETDG